MSLLFHLNYFLIYCCVRTWPAVIFQLNLCSRHSHSSKNAPGIQSDLGNQGGRVCTIQPISPNLKPRCPFIWYQIYSRAFILKTVLECTRASEGITQAVAGPHRRGRTISVGRPAGSQVNMGQRGQRFPFPPHQIKRRVDF